MTTLQIAPVAAQALAALADKLLLVCKNPQQPGFNHYLFEAVAGLIRYGCEADPAMVEKFEQSLFPAFQVVLAVRTALHTSASLLHKCAAEPDWSSERFGDDQTSSQVSGPLLALLRSIPTCKTVAASC